jgi:opacity protein-like surface antigen
MKARTAHSLLLAFFALAITVTYVNGAEPDSTQVAAAGASGSAVTPPAAAKAGGAGLIYLVPELETERYTVSEDRERFKHRIGFSPAVGKLGDNELFSFRASYSPNTWLAYEVAFGHNPADGLHALMHTFNVQLRYPLPWRMQPYGTLGYGMMTVYPGQAINADPVTKNALTYGGGLEFYIRNDVALRGEIRGATVLGQELGTDGTVAYDYREFTIGFAFFRSLGS